MKRRWDSQRDVAAEQARLNAAARKFHRVILEDRVRQRLPAEVIRERTGADIGEIRSLARDLDVKLEDPREWYGKVPA